MENQSENVNQPEECIDVRQEANWRTKFLGSEPVKRITRGLILVSPVVVLLFILSFLFNLVGKLLMPFSRLLDPGKEEPGVFIHFFTVIILLGLVYFVGQMSFSQRGSILMRRFEKDYLMRVPLYSTIRDLIHQFSGVKEMPFSRVCLIDPYDNGVLLTGFVSDTYKDKMCSVFVPTAPNPANGNLYHVPMDKLQFLSIDTETAMRTIVGMGVGASCMYNEKLIDDLIKREK